MDGREHAARALANTATQLLSVHVETADARTGDAVALAVERISESLLQWHDRLIIGAGLPTPAPPAPPERPAPSPRTPAALRAGVARSELPGSSVSLRLAASELRAAVRRIEASLPERPRPGFIVDAPGPAAGPVPREGRSDVEGRHVVNECRCLAAALEQHADILHTETERLDAAITPEHRDQVLARVVRAERRLTVAATATLTA